MHVHRIILTIITLAISMAASSQKPGEGLDVVLLGDSNTWIGGDDCSKEKGWPKWFIETFGPQSCRSYARSGATWTNTPNTVRNLSAYSEVIDDNNVIYNQIERLKAAVDKGEQPSPEVIIIGAGTNDAWFWKKRPHVFSQNVAEVFGAQDGLVTSVAKPSDAVTLAASVRLGCELLMEKFPDAQIVLLTPAQATACGYSNIRDVADIIEACGNRLSLTVIRLDKEGGIYTGAEHVKKTNTSDGTHTSVKGALRHGRFIARQLASKLLF